MDKTQITSRPINQLFLMTLIFACVGYLSQQLNINRKYITIKRWLDIKLHQIRI